MAVRITPLEINPQNHLLNVKPLNDAFTGMRKANEFDATLQHNYDRLDMDEADRADRRGIDRERLGLERQRVGLAERNARQGDEERVAQLYGSMASAVDMMPDGPERQAAWRRIMASSPNMPATLARYGQDPNDHVNGPRFLMAQSMDPVRQAQYAATRALETQRRVSTDPNQPDTHQPYRINPETNELERNEPEEASRFATPASARFPVGPNAPAIAGPRATVPAQSLTPDNTTVPGITLNRPLSGEDRGNDRRAEDAAQLWPRIRSRDQTLTMPEINRAWTGYWGKVPKAGNIYDLQGREVPNTPEGRTGSTTQNAARAAVRQSIVDVADASEVIKNSNFLERWGGHATGIGDYARVLPTITAGAASVMHGLSGAQVNIPETNRWIGMFAPGPFDGQDTIKRKLSHLQGMLMAINRQQGGNWSDDDVLKMRNMMRESVSLPRLTMREHLGTLNQSPDEPVPGDQPPRRGGNPRTGGTQPANRFEGVSDEELLRQLQGR